MKTINAIQEHKVVFPIETMPESGDSQSRVLEAAGKNHLEAAQYQQKGDFEKAAQCTVAALAYYRMASRSCK